MTRDDLLKQLIGGSKPLRYLRLKSNSFMVGHLNRPTTPGGEIRLTFNPADTQIGSIALTDRQIDTITRAKDGTFEMGERLRDG
jgi:hypothetical protein